MSKAQEIRTYHAKSEAKRLEDGVKIKTEKDLIREIRPLDANALRVIFAGQKDPEDFYYLERVDDGFLMQYKADDNHTFSFRLEGSGNDYKIVMTPDHVHQINEIRKARG